jgi:TonB dependent receptor.
LEYRHKTEWVYPEERGYWSRRSDIQQVRFSTRWRQLGQPLHYTERLSCRFLLWLEGRRHFQNPGRNWWNE